MRDRRGFTVVSGTLAVAAGVLWLAISPGLGLGAAAQSAPTAAAPGACVSPLPQPLPGAGGFGMVGGRGGRRGGADTVARSDSMPRRRGPRMRGCPPFFPDSLALTAAQTQQIVNLRSAFARLHAPELARLQAIADSARAARQAGQTLDQVRAISSEAVPLRAALRTPSEQLQQQVEATLTPGQLAWMRAHEPMRRRGGRGVGT